MITADILPVRCMADVVQGITKGSIQLARGLGRSYGDASLSKTVADMTEMDRYISFQEKTGLLTCEAGVSLADIVRTFVPRGWFLPVTPGTRYVTVGGAIAADVHGKNHHVAGTFCDHVTSLKLLTADGTIQTCSSRKNTRLFRATCGGNGLTGVILSATLRLIPVNSAWIRQTAVKAPNLPVLLDLFEQHASATYSVAWIDCMTGGKEMGRGILLTGEHADSGEIEENGHPNPLQMRQSLSLNVPFSFPVFALNSHSIRLFNALYYGRLREPESTTHVPLNPFFYPLDAVRNWNRIYGRRGFIQYQFVVPRSAGRREFQSIFQHIVQSQAGSFLAVLKAFGPGNANYLSFPTEGWTLALDFPVRPDILKLLDRLDRDILEMGGHHYLTKDSRMQPVVFRKGYADRLNRFREVKEKVDPGNRFQSIQSTRLGVIS